jgi:POT family proton-dependent oligopeptide transporter
MQISNIYLSLRSFISALFWLMIGIAAAICIGLTPVSQDPYLVWMYGSLGIVGFVAGCVFYICFRKSASLDLDTLDIVEGVEGNREEVLQVADRGKHSEA